MYCKLKDLPGLVVEDTQGLFDLWSAMVPEPGVPNVWNTVALLISDERGYLAKVQAPGLIPPFRSIGRFTDRDKAIAAILDHEQDWVLPTVPDHVHRY